MNGFPDNHGERRGHCPDLEYVAQGTLRLLDTGRLSAAANMALDTIILEEVAAGFSPPTVRFLQFEPAAALVGYHQDVTLEVRPDYCREHGIDINRRLTGGGSILFQESALGWEIFGIPGEGPFRGRYESLLERICSAAATGISRLGVSARFRPRNDIEVDGRKISGTGGTTVSGGFMVQGTLLVHNEVDRFLRALRVPVEKLKKREIESLMQRISFLSDLVQPVPSIGRIKQAVVGAFEKRLEIRTIVGDLTIRERDRLQAELPYFSSPDWIMGHHRPSREGEPVRAITQTDAGTLRVHLWPGSGGKRVRQALIVGDFFTAPGRLVHDLEAALIGRRLERRDLKAAVRQFFQETDGEIVGIGPDRIGDAIAAASERLLIVNGTFSTAEANDLFFINLQPQDLVAARPRWLLLPYCSKSLACPYRKVPGCDQCGACEIGDCYFLADEFDVEPVTIQSFEHLISVLHNRCARTEGVFVGSCCEAFYAKHQEEMERADAKGILINLDSTTCYDLGKYSEAYQGNFENKTFLNLPLIERTLRFLHGKS